MQALHGGGRAPTEGARVSGGRTHKIRATECGKARAADTFTALWSSTTCDACLAKPLRRVKVAATAPERRPDPERRPGR